MPDALARAGFSQLLVQVARVVGKPLHIEQPAVDLDDARLSLALVETEGMPASVVFIFTLTMFRIVDAATLAHLLSLNRDMLAQCALPACFCLDETGHHVQFQQRMLLNDVPLWALERYVHDTLERLRNLFVVVVKP